MDISVPEFSQDGSIVRMKFVNFMQYTDTEVTMGPNLNIIIGPNGAGKSTIVNGICIGLAGKLQVLGRAAKLSDFIQVGKEEAMLEIELFNAKGENMIVTRKWNLAGKSEWRVNGKKGPEKDVRERVAKLGIQVDNLCQFLPQDKVHDFSKLNNIALLNSTIEAVGETGLKEKHFELKERQKEYDEGHGLLARKTTIYEEKIVQLNGMEGDRKIFEQQKGLEEQLHMLKIKRLWVIYWNTRDEYKKINDQHKAEEGRLTEAHNSLKPLEKLIKRLERKITETAEKNTKNSQNEKELSGKVTTHTARANDCMEALKDLDEQEIARIRKMKEREDSKKSLKEKIKDLERDCDVNRAGNENLEELVEESKVNTRTAMEQLVAEKSNVDSKKDEINKKNNEMRRILAETKKLQDIELRKMTKLQEKDDHAFKAVQWLRNNKENFRGQVFEPLLICGNVPSQDHAIYLENAVPLREMLIFYFERVDDMNKFLDIVRRQEKLNKVGAAHIPSQVNLQSRVPASSLRSMGFVGYVKDMLEAPQPVINYICDQYPLQNIAVFQPSSEKFTEQIQKLGISRYFFGHKMQSCQRSQYSGKISTKTNDVKPKGTLGQGVDQGQIDRLSAEEGRCANELRQLNQDLQTLEMNLKHHNVAVEERKKEQREYEQSLSKIRKNNKQISLFKDRLRELEARDNGDAEKAEIKTMKGQQIAKMVNASTYVQTNMKALVTAGLENALKTMELGPLKIEAAQKGLELRNKKEGIRELEETVVQLRAQVKECQKITLASLRTATKLTGTHEKDKVRPPQSYSDYWDKHGFPNGVNMVDEKIGELEAHIACTGNVDQDILERYKDLKEETEELKIEIDGYDENRKKQKDEIEKLRSAWLDGLNSLVDNIHSRFSNLLEKMGFSGMVRLHKGRHENDFDNYGIKIFVKYRDRDGFQELDSHRQSGGERSVATAIYMLALQTLTKVPFRCVDEINQGMDSKNERRVFDLLVLTSCEESSAQYFLLTPKLLPDLNYHPKMNVLIVHNGPRMLHHSQWDMDSMADRLRSN
eukprot:TRINITY_DN1355_c0_g1_i1.p1 TRINITY_DN1355_c0_g1~~TRINITY_DN1355_c0_g1_i1.p1  ORF type:complete len:1045 (-),score=359.52 TRINITY_DN1355_c0_g1_i1:421-3555(-)